MVTDADLVILGGGCAGLSLAMRLAEQPGSCRRVVVLEARQHYQNDRTWCFWQDSCARFDALVSHRWTQLRVRSAHDSAVVSCAQSPYQLLESGAFYQKALAVLDDHPQIELHRGVLLTQAPTPLSDGWLVETPLGVLRAACLVDTRPGQQPVRGEARLWQSFLGHEVRTDRPVFDPNCVELMDFAGAGTDTVEFTYVLPLAVDRALVETTLFDPQPRSAADLADRQQRALTRQLHGASAETIRSEHGILPMGLSAKRPLSGPRYCAAGLYSGAARPATGYAFQRIQRWADACAMTLREGKGCVGHAADSWLTQAMDDLFLRVLSAEPQLAADLFVRLFARVPTPRLIRFLSDGATLGDRACVVAALPPLVFLRQLMRTALLPATRQARA